MRMLITGTEGFAGSHLAEHCLAMGDEVWGTIHPGNRCSNLSGILDQLVLRAGDVASPGFLRSVLREARFDVVFHLAAITFVPEAEREPARTYEVNLMGGLNILEAVRTESSGTRVLLASSAEVYGNAGPDAMPLREDAPINPNNIAAAAKAALEVVARPFVESYGLSVVIARPFNHTGPRQRPDFVCSSFGEQIARIERGAEPVIRVGDLRPKRDFCDVRDVVRGYRMLALKGRPGEAYNLASGRSICIRDILDMFVAMSRVQARVEVDPARIRPIEVPDIYGSTEKIEKDVGWKPEIPLERTLRDLLNWHRDRLGGGKHV
ncbi:MAG: GDP-mannose 4,6-dehydratase [Planctomycetota bacterium]|nr:GDP-mannose 4,6-dehydratase [Planctomycetota bacterium]